MKMMQGAFFLACSNISRTRLAPTPTNISTKSEPEIVEERHIGFAGDGARQQSLTGAGRANQQRAFWDFAAEALELAGVLQEFDDLAEFFLGFIDARDVLERDASLGLG